MTTPVDRMVRIYTARMINAVNLYEEQNASCGAVADLYRSHPDAEYMASTDLRAIAAAAQASRYRAAAHMYAAVVTALRADEPTTSPVMVHQRTGGGI